MYIGVFCCLFVVCVYICSAGYVELPIVLLYLLRCLVYHMLSKTARHSRSLRRVIAYIYSAGYAEVPIVLLYLLRCLVNHMLFKTRRNSGSLHRVIDEVLVLGILVVYKIPYSSCIRARHDGVCLSYCCLSGAP